MQSYDPQHDPLDIDSGVRQGDKVSTILFNLALEKVARAMGNGWKGAEIKKNGASIGR